MNIPKGLSPTERKAWIVGGAAIMDIKTNYGRQTRTAQQTLNKAWLKMRNSAEILGIALPFQSFNECYTSAIHMAREMNFISE